MKLRSVPYLIKEGIRNLWANRLMTFASIGVLCVCLLLMSNSLLISQNVTYAIEQIGSGNVIVIYLDEGMTEAEASVFGSRLKKENEHIATVEYSSSKEELEHWKKVLSDHEGLLEGIESDFLSATYSVTVDDIDYFEATVSNIKKMDGVSEVNEYSGLAKTLRDLKSAVTTAIMTIVVVLLIVSMFIIVNTVKLAMYSRRKEINIMKYVGGTDWFIRWPFIVEGFVMGLISGVLAFFIQWGLYNYIVKGVSTTVDFIKLIPFTDFIAQLAIGIIIAGCVIGTFGSSMSIRKYLKV